MENKLKIGEYNRLRIIKEVPFGLYLDGYEDEILLPLQYVPESYQIDEIIEVFIYRDSEDRIIATTLRPKATINQFAYLEVHSVTPLGVFLEWGLAKHLFVPFSQQFQKMTVGRSYLVYVYLDLQTDRIVASARIENFLPVSDIQEEFTIGDKVDAIPFEHTDLGIKCLVNNCKIGVLFKNQVFTKVTMGEPMPVYVYNIRPDDKLDLRIEPVGLVRMDSQMTKLMAVLKANNGVLMLHDKSPAELIYDQLGMSKKDFKKAVGGLYKSKQLAIHHDCISLL
jgi:predicted RNA-binding protein (virulence factor B family)